MLETKPAREQNGRDSFSRYRAQARSAAMAALSILEGGKIDRVYCDLHDDFVLRIKSEDGYLYSFYQVKTKSKLNKSWTINEVMGLKSTAKRSEEHESSKIKDSFVGKLLLHTVVFEGYCDSVVFQTNIHTDDNVDDVLEDIESGLFSNKYSKVIVERFIECFGGQGLSSSQIKERVSRLKFETDVQYLKEKDNNFEPLARESIYKFSEIELERVEFDEILLRLMELVQSKSEGVISDWTAASIEKNAGISVDDLLGILSISKEAYRSILAGGDLKAIKSASIIQRYLKKGGAGLSEIEYCSRCKSDWDMWVRKNRHVIIDFDLECIFSAVRSTLIGVRDVGGKFVLYSIRGSVKDLEARLLKDGLLFDLNLDLLFGAFFSELIKGEV
ncbi:MULTISPECIES: dsDNA nuclease domain-containing protein [unclassified Pseudomonas]|uniref:dsDNA nuclease domain-containing protein n=1 Tax=unclassified Pseudomonas TaxID=196821 RepID=UPI00249AAA59|nr:MULTISPECIES: dsDNA nuclease domain-containing protein [unclassified Pseudomonas]MDI3248471.1 dsDNA nuclease domain-containing protein [Pseudomonas sp. AL10]MDI3264359.1 dsDNA nuclease domain-containing protein [Pseudomonas sp. AL15]